MTLKNAIIITAFTLLGTSCSITEESSEKFTGSQYCKPSNVSIKETAEIGSTISYSAYAWVNTPGHCSREELESIFTPAVKAWGSDRGYKIISLEPINSKIMGHYQRKINYEH